MDDNIMCLLYCSTARDLQFKYKHHPLLSVSQISSNQDQPQHTRARTSTRMARPTCIKVSQVRFHQGQARPGRVR